MGKRKPGKPSRAQGVVDIQFRVLATGLLFA